MTEEDCLGDNESLTKPGVYWFQSGTTSRALMVEVRLTNGEFTVWWPNQDTPVATLKGHWRGRFRLPLDQGAANHSPDTSPICRSTGNQP